MRIQHNIMALNAYRQLGGNNSALAKNLEKLSSGYAINRAGDDAAGLAISEKMRAQIKGLEAAQKNANDGISLVQTAEGALTEVHSMLNRMVYLATQSANGTYDNEVDRANLDKEVQTLKEEIDRISKSTNFNGLKLLDGSMDADATKTTGGTTDVPILQEAATNPTLEVGLKTVLHKDAPEKGPTEINVELHNVQSTEKSHEGDSIKFTVGDNEVELTFGATADLANGVLKAGQAYNAEEIATAIANKFNLAGNNLIGGQEFDAVATKNSIKFTQHEDPKDPTQVVDANVDVKVEYVSNPNGNPVQYTAKIKSDALKAGNKITIGGDQLILGEGKLAGKNTLADAFGTEFETDSGYKVQYDATKGTLTVTDPNGTLGAPALKYDSYSTALKMKGTETKGEDAKKAEGKLTFANLGLAAGYTAANGDTLKIGTETYTYDGTKWNGGASYDITNEGGGFKIAAKNAGENGNTAAAIGAATIKYTMAPKANAGTATLAGGADGRAATMNVTIPAGSATGTYGGYAITIAGDAATVDDATAVAGQTPGTITGDAATGWTFTITKNAVGTAGNTGGFSGGTDATAATGTFDIDFTPADGDKITVDGVEFTFNAGAWSDGGGANANNVTLTGAGKTLTVTKGGGTVNADGFNGNINITNATPVTRTSTADLSLTGGANATNASVEFNLDTANLADGDKMIFTLANGTKKEVIWDTDLATSLTGAGLAVTDLDPLATLNGNTLKVTSAATGDAAAIPTLKLETSKREDNVVTMDTPANADSITGTWNVRSTQNKQGAAEGGGQLASTVFDLTADMVKDGNTLTIGKETYVFKIGADSTTKAAPGQTVIDLSAYKADDPDLVDYAGAALANQTGNKAFTIGYSDDGKISIHEKEGQTQYTNGELESIEEFDKLVYMNSPEVTEHTGKGLTFQVGDTADDYQQVSLSIHDMSSEGLGIADVNIATIEDAASAIDKIKAAINTVSSQRGDLGAIQNRLEHTINNLGVQTENITAAESRIRDTDMAQEMMAYTKNNILVQAAQAMLAQANQVPQGVLQLLQ